MQDESTIPQYRPENSETTNPIVSAADSHPDESQTLIVPPPSFRERLAAAQRARNAEIRASTGIPLPGEREQGDSVVLDGTSEGLSPVGPNLTETEPEV